MTLARLLWLGLAIGGAAVFGSKERRARFVEAARGLFGSARRRLHGTRRPEPLDVGSGTGETVPGTAKDYAGPI